VVMKNYYETIINPFSVLVSFLGFQFLVPSPGWRAARD